eukprot:CAMPEP_0113435044 /NCGR_PEP_ID=MMETSP0013_2-20120614/36030_1 /TAXON_ID=2843 ORGANISM="Skeletonema costatum, Strain 1716" /NCGR_SAMPLE_ID=MMETSP0013_2 /ASSEMBLY_ACC=CAM_ASM_000158 /LENGTH=626 /DNA_ID=CAMNT_0000325321 /DNA_START=36 /DNA_END=1913 /DNA_ORIENTATION=- /assembly_acc=CAM_ASM_000158
MSNDIEAGGPAAASESTPLVGDSPSSDQLNSSISSGSVTSTDDIKEELEKPWPATFERGIQILASPMLDVRKVADYTKSPSVRARYKKHPLNRGYDTPEPPTMTSSSPGTPAWLKKSLVRMKSLDYRFSDDNTAIYNKKQQQMQRNQQQFQAKKLDAHAYRQKILQERKQGGFASSAGDLVIDSEDLQDVDVTKSPGYRREKHMDKQRKRENMKSRRESSTSSSSASSTSSEAEDSSKSSFSQCTFNMANILMGVGMLGLPNVFKSAGWIGGTCVTIGFCLVTWKTSYYLGRALNGDPRPVHLFDGSDLTIKRMRKPVSSFPEIAREAFGDNGCICLSAVLYFELFSCLSIFFVSLGDHLHALFPNISQAKHMTIVAGILTLPSALLRTPKLLSYLSMVGTFATVAVVSSVVASALYMFFTVGDSAGVEKEDYALYSSSGLPLAMGIVAYCFSGHAIVPSIYNSMQRPHEFERMIDLTYGVVLSACLFVAVSGYYMFGDDVDDQITISLEKRAGDGNLAMDCLTWLMILTACSKFTLTMFPLALGFEEMLTNILPSDLAMELVDSVVKIVLIFLALAVAIWFPSFSFLCSLVGLICTVIVSVIFPALANLRLFGPSLPLSEKLFGW